MLVSAFQSHLDLTQMHVHGDIYALDSACDLSSVFQFDDHCLVGQFHEETNQLHSAVVIDLELKILRGYL